MAMGTVSDGIANTEGAMKIHLLSSVTFLCIISSSVVAEGENVAPGDNMHLDGIPAISRDLALTADSYGNYRSARFLQWHPQRVEMLVSTRFGNTSQVHRVRTPGGQREQLTFFKEAVLGVSAYESDNASDFFTYLIDVGGDEFYQIFRFDAASRAATLLTDGKKRHSGGIYSRAAGLSAYQRVDADKEGAFSEIHVIDPTKPKSDRLVTTLRGGGWWSTDWSPDGSSLLLREYISINDSRVYILEVASGELQRLQPVDIGDTPVAVGSAIFAPDGRGIYFSSDEGSEFRHLIHVDLVSGVRQDLTTDISWDVSAYDVSSDGKHIAIVTNEAGVGRLNIIERESGRKISLPDIPSGVINGIRWHDNARHLAFSLASATIPGDVFVLDLATNEVSRWTDSETGIDTNGFAEARLVKWKSFDGETISGFLYNPPKQFVGKRPVVISIHGGPEGQSVPRYLGRWNYFLNELGVAILYPNVRGSTGYGKTFVKLDNGILREGTYKDIGALLDWIGTQGNLDPMRIMVFGGSYGGHMSLAVATRYSDRLRCSVNLFGLSNLRTFLENTQGYRRDLRRVEYGDERNPEIRAWMDSSSPMNLVENIRKPMLVQQGVNDPRVPKSESDQIVASLKKIGTPTWYLVFDDEGHGWRKKVNADFAFYSTILFAQTYLLD